MFQQRTFIMPRVLFVAQKLVSNLYTMNGPNMEIVL